MRAYYFGNMYLSSIQQGIQAAHVTHELFTKHSPGFNDDPSEEFLLLDEWARNHKTMILLNGGYMETILELVGFFESDENPYPWATFREGEDSLGGILTSVGIVLPEKIYLTASLIRSERLPRGVRTTREMLEEDGEFVVLPDNKIGFKVTEPTTIEISKWEYDLINRLNQFGLAR